MPATATFDTRDFEAQLRIIHLRAFHELVALLDQGRPASFAFECVPSAVALRSVDLGLPTALLTDLRFHAPLKASITAFLLRAYAWWRDCGSPALPTDAVEHGLPWLERLLIECTDPMFFAMPRTV